MKRILATVLVLCLVVTLLPISVQAWGIVDCGDWSQEGSNVTWTLYTDGTLIVSGTGAMLDCYQVGKEWFRVWDAYYQSITSVVIEEGITYIGAESFSCAPNLISVSIPDSVTYIGRRAFADCDSLTNVSLGNGLEETDIEVFFGCSALTDFSFPDSATEYGNHFLAHCDKLSNVTLSDQITGIPDGMFEKCISLKNITIPGSVTYIGYEAFSGCTALRNIAIPESVTTIGDLAFAYCTILESISLPDSLVEMGNSVFVNCLALSEVVVPVNVTTMAHTFQEACGLKSIKFLGNAPICGGNLFGNIEVTVYYPGNNRTWTEVVRQNYGGTVTWESYESDITPNGIIGSGVCGDALTWTLTDNYILTISGTGEMYDYLDNTPWRDYRDKIEYIVIEDGVTSIGRGGFQEFRVLKNATIGNSVTTLGPTCFNNCVKLEKLVIPDSVMNIEVGAFGGCISLKRIQFNGNAPQMDNIFFSEVQTNAYYPANNDTWTPEVLKNYGGTITWVPYNPEDLEKQSVVRVFGATRYETAFEAADMLKELQGVEKFQTIVVACGTDFADALSGSYLANQKNAPILLVRNRNQEIEQVKAYIRNNLAAGGTVYLLGGTAVIPASMETGLDGFTVKRLAGATRYETNLAILKEAGVGDKDVLVCTGKNFADGLSASAVNLPILLVKDSLNSNQTEFLKSLGGDNKIYIIGGTNAVNKNIAGVLATYGAVERIEGATRYETSVNIAKEFFADADCAVLAYGNNFPDGLSGGALAYALNAPLILTADGKESAAVTYATVAGIDSGVVLGGSGLISDKVVRKIYQMDNNAAIPVK